MNTIDKDLVKAIAVSVMGWPAIEDPDAPTAHDGPAIYEHKGRLLKGETYKSPYDESNTPYRYTWSLWNPLVNPAHYAEIMDRLLAQGHRTILESNPDGHLFRIIHGQHASTYAMFHSRDLRGRAICLASLMFYEDCLRKFDAAGQLKKKETVIAEVKATLKTMLDKAKLPAAYHYVTVDDTGDCYAWPERPAAGDHVWQSNREDEHCIGMISLPDGIDWSELIFDMDEGQPFTHSNMLETAAL